MRKFSGNVLFLVASIALAVGTQATWCEVVNLFGGDAHHHVENGDSLCLTSHQLCDHGHQSDTSHEEERVPCSEESAFDFSDGQLPRSEAATISALVVDLPAWLDVRPPVARTIFEERAFPVPERSGHLPQQHSPSFTGCFLI